MIPEQIIEEIKARSELVSVVEQYVHLDKRSGSNFFGLCPFHSEDTPSFSVSPSKQIYYCFGCHKGGDVIHFIMDVEKCSYPLAIRSLAERAGIQIPESEDEEYRQRSELNKQLQAIDLEAARYFYHCLNSSDGTACREYLSKRGLTTSTIRKFGLGYAPEGWDGLFLHLRAKGFTDEDLLLKTGLFKRGKTGQLYDLFRHRLMFPIMDVMGKVVAFGGRVLDDSMPKYINSPENPVYTKGRHLFGLNLAKSSHQPNLVMVEGYMDAIALHQAGVDNTVASLGTALTENQAQLLRKYTDSVVIAYDADAAGQTAALRSLDILSSKGIKVTVLQVPEGKDPDEYIQRNGPERFHSLLDKALPLLDFKLLAVRRANTVGTELDILGYQDAACRILAQEENAIVRELYSVKLAEELNATSETVLREIERRHTSPVDSKQKDQLRHKLQQAIPVAQAPEEIESAVTREELYLLSMLAAEPDVWDKLTTKPSVEDFSDGAMQEIAAAALKMASERQLDPARLVGLGENRIARGQPLHELLARASMKLENKDTYGHQGLTLAAAEQLRRQRLIRLQQKKARLNDEIAATNDINIKCQLKESLRLTGEQITQLRNGID